MAKSCGQASWFTRPKFPDLRSAGGRFGFDRILDSRDPKSPYYASQAVVYKHVGMRIVQDCLRGFNCCVFANGRTATGKTSASRGALLGKRSGVRSPTA